MFWTNDFSSFRPNVPSFGGYRSHIFAVAFVSGRPVSVGPFCSVNPSLNRASGKRVLQRLGLRIRHYHSSGLAFVLAGAFAGILIDTCVRSSAPGKTSGLQGCAQALRIFGASASLSPAVRGWCMSAPALGREIENLQATVLELQAKVIRLEGRVAELEAERSEFTVVDLPAGSSSSGGPLAGPARAPEPVQGPTEEERKLIVEEVGRFLRRCVNGEARGTSSRDRLPLASRYWIVVRTFEGQTLSPPTVCSRFWSSADPTVENRSLWACPARPT